MFHSFKNIYAVVNRQIGRQILPSYQASCLNSGESLPSHDKPHEKKAVRPDDDERKKEKDSNDSMVLAIANKITFHIDTLAFLQQLPSLNWTIIKEWRKKSIEDKKVCDQRFIAERLQILGSDLAAAHFIVHRGGTVKFKDQSDWIQKNEEDKYTLPSKFVPNLYLEAIDASRTQLIYEGFQNLEHLYHLKSLNLSYCDEIDDWCLDRLHIFKESLEHLDISGCPNITERGLCCLYRLRNLKTLNVTNMPNISHIHLVCLLLEEVLPQCKILGVDYTDLETQQDSSIDKEFYNEKMRDSPL